MPSPFPGMNPFLEHPDAWDDFHPRFIVAMASVLERSIPENYFVKVRSRSYLHEFSAEERRLHLDNVEEVRQQFLEIFDRRHHRVVTAIELLSPTNKTEGPDRDFYLSQRAWNLVSPSFVEIDFRRGGQRPGPPRLPACDYYVLVRRATDQSQVGIWPIGLRDPLPNIPVPLAAPDPDVVLYLQALLHEVYDEAGFAKYIYRDTPEPPLGADDLAWAKSLVPAIP